MILQKYQTIEADACHLILGKHGLSTVTNQTLWNFLTEWAVTPNITKTQIVHEIDHTDLDRSDTIKFLEETIGFKSEAKGFFSATRIFYEASNPFERIVNRVFPGELDIVISCSELPETKHGDSNLDILLFCDPTMEASKESYQQHIKKNPHNGVLAGYFSNNQFVLTSPHLTDIGNPCAYCTLDRALHYLKIRKTSSSWALITKYFTEYRIPLPPPILTELHIPMIASFISLTIDLYTSENRASHQDDVYLERSLDLSTGDVSKALPTHWYLCNCWRIYD